ncbi:MAG: phosphoserine phosphatase SerB [Halobacteriovoraceae bacterium]|nr:phosphoserine phosphatase SerB [Halobacteriovoraceae bacterium]
MNQEQNNILVTVSGPDHPGITTTLMEIIDKGSHRLLDMGQSVTHGLLSLSFLLNDNSEFGKDTPVLKELLFSAKKMGLTLDFDIVSFGEVKAIEKSEKYILNCVSTDYLSAAFLKEATSVLAKHNINILRIDNVNPGCFKSIEISGRVQSSVNLQDVKKELYAISQRHAVDIAFLRDNIFRRNKRLIVFDMDSTLIQHEVIDELANIYGVGEEVSKVTEEAMNGLLDFDESLKKRVSKLKGLEENNLKQILDQLKFTPGAEEFITTVKQLGYKVAIISGGFSYFANALKDKLGLDYAFANELEIIDGKLTGNVVGAIVNANQKAILLQLIAQQEGISLEQVVAIGDGANDLQMLSKAGLGIAFHAKEIVNQKANHHMGHGPMTSILYFLGIHENINE